MICLKKEGIMERISVTQAVRQFSDLMNRVCYQGTVVELERGNRVIARIAPVAQESPMKVKYLNRFFHELPSLAGDSKDFVEDLANIRKQIPMERNQWD
jgi:antitoxin (DNA-binding transcriptional repressor) of toxin-antitoxin stability system